MIKKDQTLNNTLTGEKVIFRKTVKETGGLAVEFEQFLPPGRGQTAEHVHLEKVERFTVISGTAVYSINGVDGIAGPGEVVDFPVNVVHVNPRNVSYEMLHLLRVVEPGAGVEEFYETIFGLASEGKTNENSFPNPLQLAVMFHVLDDTTYFFPRQLPIWIQKPLWHFLGIVGQLVGFKATYPRYNVSK